MFKKLSITFLFLLTLALALVSCEIPNLQIPQAQMPHTHTYGEWETVKSANCTQEGSKERYCICGEKQTAAIAMKEHEYGLWLVSKEATYDEYGIETRTCSCGKTETRSIPKKVEPTTTVLTRNQYIAEISEIFSNTTNQTNLKFKDKYDGGSDTYSYYANGMDSLVYILADDGFEYVEMWVGKSGNEYLAFIKGFEGSSPATKTYEETSISEVESMIQGIKSIIYEDIWDYASLQYDSNDYFECKKVANDKTVYQITGIDGISTHYVNVTVENGLLSEISFTTTVNWGELTSTYTDVITFTYDDIITMPNKNEFTPA